MSTERECAAAACEIGCAGLTRAAFGRHGMFAGTCPLKQLRNICGAHSCERVGHAILTGLLAVKMVTMEVSHEHRDDRAASAARVMLS
jgi:hypothetical protein